jgi:hypothetical protein
MDFTIRRERNGEMSLIPNLRPERGKYIVQANTSDTRLLRRIKGYGQYEVAILVKEEDPKPKYRLHLHSSPEMMIRLEYPRRVGDHYETDFHWQERDFRWYGNKKMVDSLTRAPVIEFTSKSWLKRVFCNKRPTLTIYPSTLPLRPLEPERPAPTQHPNSGNAIDMVKKILFHQKSADPAQAAEDNGLKKLRELSDDDFSELKIDLLITVAVAMRLQWKQVRKEPRGERGASLQE